MTTTRSEEWARGDKNQRPPLEIRKSDDEEDKATITINTFRAYEGVLWPSMHTHTMYGYSVKRVRPISTYPAQNHNACEE